MNILNKKRTFIIAEAGINHNGSVKLAKLLIEKAKEAGADAIKFQNFNENNIISKFAKKVDYQKKNLKDKETQLTMLKKVQLNDKDFLELKKFSDKKKIIFLSTAKDIDSAKLLIKLKVPLYKVGSAETNNYEFLKFLAKQNKPIILSTGLCNLNEVKKAFSAIKAISKSDVILLHCVSKYPAPINQVNLKSMVTMKNTFNVKVGYSDHTIGNQVCLAAVSLGAKVIEKHFTINKNLEGPDHKVSMNFNDLKSLVTSIRLIESCMGDGVKKPAKCEIKNIKLLRRSLVYKKDFKKGHILKSDDIAIKRPGNGLSPEFKNKILNKKIKKNVKEDERIAWSNLL